MTSKSLLRHLAPVFALLALAPVLKAGDKAPFTTLYKFAGAGKNGVNSDGSFPAAALIQGNDGELYGVTKSGGSTGGGTIFRLASAEHIDTLHSFDTSKDTKGWGPESALLQGNDGTFYGATRYGGSKSFGAIFGFSLKDGSAITPLYTFGGNDGAYPVSAPIQAKDGDFYGTTPAGGTNDAGTIYRLTSAGKLSTLHHFSATDGGGVNTDGATPSAALIQSSAGDFYGTTDGGGSHGTGTVYRITSDGKLSPLHQFGAVDKNGANADGAYPHAALIQGEDGDFYGTTTGGGTNGTGTIYRITSTGKLFTLHHFGTKESSGSNVGGWYPEAVLTQGKDGAFYGSTLYGGRAGFGTLFRLVLKGGTTLITLHSFDGSDGANPHAALLQAKDGYFYGAARNGGPNKTGTLFRVNILNPVITSPETAKATLGKTFTYQITATNDPTKFSADFLAAGLTVDQSSGKISGVPRSPGTYKGKVTATNTVGTGSGQLTLTVK